ncbi:hypothetical protein WN71_024925 [Streptomyces mangrovisoli]|uniref:Restriction endonuclease type IV Mrr domain-containing protein n=1 Tax=Streptomyces mangrovisoli TaxID=1428628 RepID=A0A1J4NVG1_9ACTN|nr:hypothetical protein WN71_024925 [Streptomyces mangrovisoli]
MNPRAAPTAVTRRSWDDDWVTVRCACCGRRGEWPYPELGCPCGTVLRIPVAETPAAPQPKAAGPKAPEPETPEPIAPEPKAPRPKAPNAKAPEPEAPNPKVPHPKVPRPKAPHPKAPAPERAGRRGAYEPVEIRTARDAVTATVLYLRALGYGDVRRADQRPPSGIGLAARGLVVLVDAGARPASLRDVECLWLTAMTEPADCVCFSLAGYADDARERADGLGVPLFLLARSGAPRPVNDPARALDASGARRG